MMNSPAHVLTVNGGSSSIKFALYDASQPLRRTLSGAIERIGLSGTQLRFDDSIHQRHGGRAVAASDHRSAGVALLDWLAAEVSVASLGAVGHRVVHGMRHLKPELVNQELLEELRQLEPYAPDHLPGELALIEAFRQRLPAVPQVACFDTAFHAHLPRVAKLLSIPRRYAGRGLERYGFHGLSYTYLLEELERVAGTAVAQGRVIFAHLGNGSSLAAVRAGQSLDTTMGFTPAAGLIMGTRSGDLDPGLVSFLARTEAMTASQFDRMVNHESGLLGVSETSSDMRDLLGREREDVRAAEAVELFCYQAKKWLGAYTAVLGGLDTLVFAGGIGENSPQVRARICDGLGFLGIELDEPRNQAGEGLISGDMGRVAVRVLRTDEELMIARQVCAILRMGANIGD
jgi:acetate kinase